MTRSRFRSTGLRASLFALLVLTAPAAAAGLPGDSVYHVNAALTDQHGTSSQFSDAAGQVRLATMFYATCPYVCPMLIEQLRRIEAALEPAEREQLQIMLISMDPERDTPQVLTELAEKRRIDTTRWSLLQPDPAGLRRISAVLGVQYRQTDDGEFNHSSVISLLDPQGRILAQTQRLDQEPDPEFIQALRAALATAR